MKNTQEILDKIQKYGRLMNVPIILDDSKDILLDLIRQHQPKKILEIGTAIGYSGSLMLINSPASKLTTIEILPSAYEVAKDNFAELGLLDRVNMILGDANEVVKNLNDDYDFIFMDGPKSKYLHQFPYLLKHLKKDGIIFADNVLFKGRVLGDDYPKHKHRTLILNLRKFLKLVQEDKALKSTLLDAGDGILIIQKV